MGKMRVRTKNVWIALYAVIVFGYVLSVLSWISNLSTMWGAPGAQVIGYYVVNFGAVIIQLGIFVYGLILSLQGRVSPRKAGIIMTVFLLTDCLSECYNYFIVKTTTYIYTVDLYMHIIPMAVGCAAVALFFIGGSRRKICEILLYIVAAVLEACSIYSVCVMIQVGVANSYIGMDTYAWVLLATCQYFLLVYQVYHISKRRQRFVQEDEAA